MDRWISLFRGRALLVVTVSLTLSVIPAAVAAPEAAPELEMQGCRQVYAFLPVAAERARPLVPLAYRLLGERGGVAHVQVLARRCDAVRLGGEREPAVEARVSIGIESPDGTGDMAGLPCCNYYLLSWATDSPLLASWLRTGTGLAGATVPEVDDLAYDFRPRAGIDTGFLFVAPSPTPSPFTISAAVAEPSRAQRLTFRSNFWADTATGRAKLTIFTDNERLSWAHGELRVASSSPLAELLGGERHTFGGPQSAFDFDAATVTKEHTAL